MKIYSNNQVDIATVSSADATVNYPASNVQDTRLTRIYKGDEQIDFDITGDGAKKNIFQAYTNLVQDPTDLTTGNWSTTKIDVTDSGETLDGEIFWKFTSNDSGAARLEQAFVVNDTESTHLVTVRKGNQDDVTFTVYNDTTASNVGLVEIDFATQTVSISVGSDLDATFHDDNTVKIYHRNATITSGNTLRLRYYVEFTTSVSGDYTLYTMPQMTEGTTMFPFVDGTHSADVIDETQTMPDKFIIDDVADLRFSYDTSTDTYILTWFIDGTHRLQLKYVTALDKYYLVWQDGGTARSLITPQLDDGTTYIDINQRFRFTVFLNLVSGVATDSMFILTPLESGSQAITNSFDGTPNTRTSTFPTLSIGNLSTSYQANSIMEYLRLYEWDGVKPTITDNDDITEYLEDKKIIYDTEYMTKLTATDLLIANTTINAGDTITLRANDVDSYGSGTPLDETISYDGSEILTHSFDLSSYQYWRLSVNSSNVIDIGRIYLGENVATPGIGTRISDNRSSKSVKTISVSGQSYMDRRYINQEVSVRFPKVSFTQKAEMIEIFETIDIGTPFFIYFNETCTDLTVMYVTLDQSSLAFNLLSDVNYYESSLSIMEEI